MTRNAAYDDGLEFTGHFHTDRARVEASAKAICNQGFHAVVVIEPSNKQSTYFTTGGYSVFAEDAYFKAKNAYDKWARAKAKVVFLHNAIEETKAAVIRLEGELAEAQALAALPEPKAVY